MKSLFSLLLAAAMPVGSIFGASLVTYTFDGNFSPSNVNSNLSASGFNGNGSKAQVGLGEVDGEKYGYILLKQKATGANASQQNSQFGQFSLEQIGGFQGQITSITLKAARAGDFSGSGLAIRWSYDNYSSNLGTISVSNGPSNFRSFTINFDNPLIFGGSVTFRLYAYSSDSRQSMRFQDLVLNGNFVQFPPDTGPPDVVVFGSSLTKRTNTQNYTLSGTSSDENTVNVVEYSSSKSGPWTVAEGTSPWKFTSKLDRGVNKFFIRAIDFAGSVSDPIKVTVRYKPKKEDPDSSKKKRRRDRRRQR